MSLPQELFQPRLKMTGTLSVNKHEISSIIGFSDQLITYVLKNKRAVISLSTRFHDIEIGSDA